MKQVLVFILFSASLAAQIRVPGNWYFEGGVNVLTDTGSANSYSATLLPALSAYNTNQNWCFIPAHNNTGASTLNINSLGPKTIQKSGGSASTGGEIVAGQPSCVMYDGTNFQLQGGGSASGVSSFNTRSGAVTLTSGDVTTALTFTPENAANKDAASGYAGLTAGSLLKTAEIPPASASALGGVQSITSLAHNWISYIDLSGIPHQSQPAVGDISGFGTGVATFLATPSSANLASAITDETGTGAAVFATNPVFVTPNLGTPSAINLANATNLPVGATPLTTSQDILYRNAGGALDRLPIVTAGNCLGNSGGVWATVSCGGGGPNAVLNNQANTYTGGGLQDMGAMDLLLPKHSSDPSCVAGQIEFNTTGAAGKICTATNTWGTLGTGGSVTSIVGGFGLTGGTITTTGTFAVNTAVIASRAQLTAGSDQACVSSNGTTAYTCTHSNVWTAYGQFFLLSADVASNSSASVNADGIGTLTLYRNDCATSIGTDIPAGGTMWFQYNGTKACEVGAVGGSGTVTSVGLVGTSNQLTVTGASPITTSGSWTISFPTGGVTLPGATTLSGGLTAASLATVGTVAGSVCATSGGLVLYEAGVNCYGTAFSGITAGTNTNALLVGAGGTLEPTSTGVIEATSIVDSSQLNALTTVHTASAVDYFSITNAATANPATVSLNAAGSDSNINISLVPKGTGIVQANGGLSIGPSAPTGVTPGTAGLWVAAYGTAPSGITTGMGGIWLDSTQGGWLTKVQTGSIVPIPTTPATTAANYVPQYADTKGLALGAGLPVATTATANSLVETGGGGTINVNFVPAGAIYNYTTTSFSATPTFTFGAGASNTFKITLTGNVTSSTVASSVAGQLATFVICQDGTGSRTFTWPSGFHGAMTVGSTASMCNSQTFSFDGSAYWATSTGVTNE